MSESSVKRIFSQKTFTLERLEEICSVAGLSVFDLVQQSKQDSEEALHTYTNEQEAFFSKYPAAFAFWDKLLFGDSVDEITTQHSIPHTDAVFYLSNLDRLKLIEWGAEDLVKILVPRNIHWQKNGTLQRTFLESAKSNFINHDFADDEMIFKFSVVEFSRKELEEFREKIQKLHDEMIEASPDASSTDRKLTNYGFAFGLRPWDLNEVFESALSTPRADRKT